MRSMAPDRSSMSATATPAANELRAVEVDDFNVGLPRMSAALRRTGPGEVPTILRLRRYDSIQVGHILMGYSKVGYVDTDSDVVVVVTARHAPAGSKWDEAELVTGDTALYPGGGHHQAVDPAGMDAGFVVIDEEPLSEVIDDLGRERQRLRQGLLQRDAAVAFRRAFDRAAFSPDPAQLIHAVAMDVCTTGSVRDPGPPRGRSSEKVVRTATRHARDHGLWQPSIVELCRAAGVSERRLQLAFLDVYDCTPSEFFRARALSEARSRLVKRPEVEAPVTYVATELGFHHLGRFAARFHQQFGVYPSDLVGDKPGSKNHTEHTKSD